MNPEISDRLDAIDNVVDWAQNERPGAVERGTLKSDYEEYTEELLGHHLGPVKDLTREVRELLETHDAGNWSAPEEPGEPTSEPPAEPMTNYMDGLQGAMTAPTHWDGNPGAIDVYTTGGEGTWIAMPIGGDVSIQTTPTPGGVMYSALFQADNGWTYLFGHINEYQYRTGRVEANVPFACQGLSGLWNIRQYAPSHIHFACIRGHVQMDADGMGDVRAVDAWQGLGFGLGEIVGHIPGPQEYEQGGWYAGRLRG